MDFESLIGEQIEQYRIKELVGRGNLATVYRAVDVNLARSVALKIIHPHFAQNEAWRAHFLQKARTAARITNPAIVPIYNSGLKNGNLYIVSAFADGISLAAILRRLQEEQQLIRMDETIFIIARIADVLGVAHQEGLLHLDIKPENIFVQKTERPVRGGELPLRIQLTDFGLAAVPNTRKRSLSHQVNAYQYLPPEYWLGRKVDGRADIYSLSTLLYYLIAGQHPYPIQSASEAAMRHTLEEPAPIQTVLSAVPDPLAEIIHRGLQKKADQRFAITEQMADALRECAAALTPEQTFFTGAQAAVVSLREQWTAIVSGDPVQAADPPNGAGPQPARHTPTVPTKGAAHELPPYNGRNLPPTGLSILAMPGGTNGFDYHAAPVAPPDVKKTPPPTFTEPDEPAPAPQINTVEESHTPEILLLEESDQQHTELHTLPPQLGDQIIITRQGRGPRRISLNKPIMHVGRARENEILLSAPDVSRRHAQIEQTEDGEGWLIADLGSQGGTFLAGKRLESFQKTSWSQSQTVQIGPYFLHWRPAGAADQALVNEATEEQQTELFPVSEDGGQVQSSAGNYRVALSPATLALGPGEQHIVQVEIFNQGTEVADFHFSLTGLPADCYTIPHDITGVAPGARATLPLKIHLPTISQSPSHHLAAGTRTLELLVRSSMDKTETAAIGVQLIIHPVEQFAMGIWPTELVSGKQCRIMIRNEGNVVSNYGLVGRDPTGTLIFSGQRGRIRLAPGEATNEALTVQHPRRSLLGRRRQFPFTIEVQTATGQSQNRSGQLELRPRVPSWTLPLLELLLMIGLILVVLNNVLGGGARADDGAGESGTAAPAAAETGSDAPFAPPNDQDGDLLLDDEERRLGTDPTVVDTDGDGVPDGLEVQLHRTDPTLADTDGDGLSDGEELNQINSDPNLADTDLDGMPDGEELESGRDPLRFDGDEAAEETTEPAEKSAETNAAPTAVPGTTIQLPYIPEASGWVSAGGEVGGAEQPRAGDQAGDELLHGFIAYDLTAIPKEAELTAAVLEFSVAEQFGDPFNDLGCLQLSAVESPQPLSAESYEAPAFFINCEPGPPVNVDLLPDLQAARESGATLLLLRLGFAGESDGDGVEDGYMLTTAPFLNVTYNAP